MLDQDFLTHAISSVTFLSRAMPKQMIAIKDLNSTYIFCSDYLAKLTSSAISDLIGKKVWLSLYDDDPSFEKIIIEEDQKIINSREPNVLLKINKFCTGLMSYLAVKTPLINPETNHVVGILFQGFEIGLTDLTTVVKNLTPPKKLVELHDLPKLTKREKQIVFFFMANLSSHEIAEMLYTIEGKRISKSTIDSIFNDQLYLKFDVYNRVALYKKLQSLGYEKMIPKELLSPKSIMLDIIHAY